MYATLIVVSGETREQRFRVRLPALLGRGRHADLTIAHLLISREHCQLREQEGVVMLTDLGSLNGTFCRNRRIQHAPLLPDDQFSIGPLTFKIEYEYGGVEKIKNEPDDGSTPNLPSVALPDPVESPLVELDDPVRVSNASDSPVIAAPRHVTHLHSGRIAGFAYREADRRRRASNGSELDKMVEIDAPHSLGERDAAPFDALTSQSPSPEKEDDLPPSDTLRRPSETED